MLKGILNLLLAVFICSMSWAQAPTIQVISQYTCVGGTNSYRASGGTVTSWTINGPYSNLTTSSDKTRISFTWSGTRTNASVSVTTSTGTASTPVFNVTAPIVPSVTISPSSVSIVSGTSVTFTATPVNGGTSPYYAWYINDVSKATNVNSYSTAALQNGDKVYATLLSNAACPPNVTVTSNTVTASVTYPISPPSVQSYSIPFNTSKVLDATGASTNEVYRWYDAQTGGTLLGQGLQYQTAVLTDNKTYYVSKYNTSNLAESGRVAQTVTVIVPDPDVPVLSTNTCGDKILTRITPPSGIIWYWQDTNSAGTSVANSVSSYTITDAKNKTYYIRAKSATGSVWSNSVGVAVTTDPSDLIVTNYQSQNSVIQATYSITFKPGFAVTGGDQLAARIAITSECNDKYNWDEQIAYDQNGQAISRERDYASGLGDLLQSQRFDYAAGKIFSSQPLYDSYNDIAGITLPAPLPANDFLFKRKWITNSSGTAYTATDFDVNINSPTPVGSDIGSVGWYYSSANTMEPLTPTTNYPYTRAYSSPGPDQKAVRVGGPGDQYRLGASHEVGVDKQKIAIGELNHYYTVKGLLNLPGGNPGATASVGYKLISTDSDNKQTVEFVDAEGKILASAIMINNAYDSWTYTFYNTIGQVVAMVDPKGIDTNNNSTLPGFITYYKYDHLGRLIETTSPDEGKTQFVYSIDGKLRFSQNAEQRAQNKFSYTNYDFLGRLVEAGEYISNGTSPYVFEPHTTATPALKSILKIADNNIPVGQTAQSITSQNYTGISKTIDATRCLDHTYIIYDGQPGDLPTGDAAHAKQNNLVGKASKTKNTLATTWYSYTEFGELEWIKQQITGLTGYQVIDYSYDYLGNVTQVSYNKGATGQFYHYYEYDADQRLSKVYTSKDGSTKKLEATYYYYLHGPLKRVELGNKLQGIDYVYNIDGSLKFINHPDPALDPGADGISGVNAGFMKDIFGEALDYNSNDYASPGYTGANLQLDASYPDQFGGLTKAVRWHNAVDSHVPRAYAFKYDKNNQIDAADFGDISKSGNSNYTYASSSVQAYKEDVSNYDNNGNINGLVRNGKTGNVLGNYVYNYQANTNRLASVTHNGSAFLTYQYNANGQLIQQTEGGNTLSIDYTVYGLVKEIRKGANKLLTCEYDDRGDCAIKTIYDPVASGNPIVKKVFYIYDAGGNVVAIYEQPTGGSLTQIEIPIYGEGRIGMYKPVSSTTFYEVSDHQGNVRGVIGNPSPLKYTATLEDNGAADITNPRIQEMMSFKNISATAVADSRMNHTPDTVVSNPQYSAYLKWISGMSGQDAKDKSIGPAIALKVEPGDQINIEAWAKYKKKASYTRSGIAAAMASILGNSYVGTASGLDVLANATQTFQNGLLAVTGSGGNGGDASLLPHAYVYYLLYDRSFNFVTAGWQRVTTAGGFDAGNEALSSHEKLSIPGLKFTEPGYVYIFVSNESENTEVWFDDLHIDHQRSTVVAGADYYPFGLAMENREITREDYRYGYQGQYSEEQKETGWNFFELRMYDARIGRWLTVDPYGQFASPYIGMGNIPHIATDPNGGLCCGDIPEVAINATAANQAMLGAAALSKSINDPFVLLPAVTITHSLLTRTIVSGIASRIIPLMQRTWSFLNGAVNAVNSNETLGLVPLKDPESQPHSFDYANGQRAGHMLSVAMGIYQTYLGIQTTYIGGAMALSGGGTALSPAVIGFGLGVTSHGALVTSRAWSNLGKVHNVNMAARYRKHVMKIHHIASNKHFSKYTRLFENIAKKFKLKLDGEWNKVPISEVYHHSNHPVEYHEFVLDGMKRAAAEARGSQAKFLELFDEYVKKPLLEDPSMLLHK